MDRVLGCGLPEQDVAPCLPQCGYVSHEEGPPTNSATRGSSAEQQTVTSPQQVPAAHEAEHQAEVPQAASQPPPAPDPSHLPGDVEPSYDGGGLKEDAALVSSTRRQPLVPPKVLGRGVLLPGGTPILVTAYPRAHCSRALASLRLAWACEQLLAATQRAISAPQALGLAANAAVALINFSQSSEEQISVPGVHDTSTGHASVGQQQGAEAHTSDRHHPTQSSTAPTHDSTTATTTTRTAQGSTVIADSLSGEYMVVLHDLPPGQPLSSLLGVVRPSEGHPLSCPDNPRSMDWGAVLTIALHVCSALHGLHAKGLAHGDVRAPYIWAYRGPLPQAQRSSQPMQASLAAAGGSQAYPRESHSTFSRGDTGSMAAMLQPSTIHTATTGTSTAFTSATLRGYASMADSRASAVFERFSGIIGGQPSSDSNAMGGSSVTFQLASLLGASGEISMAPPRVLMPRPNRPSFGAAPGVTSAGSTTSVVLATLLWSPLCGWVRPAREQALASAHLTSHFAALQSGRQQAGGTGTSVSTLPSSSAPVTAAGGAHVAPELHSGGLATPAGDVYALGILLWSLVNCEHAYDGLPLDHLSHVRHASVRPVFPPSCPSSIRQLALMCMQQDPDQRPSTAVVMRELQSMLAVHHMWPSQFFALPSSTNGDNSSLDLLALNPSRGTPDFVANLATVGGLGPNSINTSGAMGDFASHSEFSVANWSPLAASSHGVANPLAPLEASAVQLQLLAAQADTSREDASARSSGQSAPYSSSHGSRAHPLQGIAAGLRGPGGSRTQEAMMSVRPASSGMTGATTSALSSGGPEGRQVQQAAGGSGLRGGQARLLVSALASCPPPAGPDLHGPLPLFRQQRRSVDAGRRPLPEEGAGSSRSVPGPADSMQRGSHTTLTQTPTPTATSMTRTSGSIPPGADRPSAALSSGGWSFLQTPGGPLLQPTWSRPLDGTIAEGQQQFGGGYGEAPQLVSSSLLKLLQAGTEAGASSQAPNSQDETAQQPGAAGAGYLRDGMTAPAVPGASGAPRVAPSPGGGPVVRQLSDPTSSGGQTRQSSNPLIFDLAALDLTDPAVLARLDTAGSAGQGPGSHLHRGRAAAAAMAAAARSPGSGHTRANTSHSAALQSGGSRGRIHGQHHGGGVAEDTTAEGGSHGPPTLLSLMQAGGSGAGQQSQQHSQQLHYQESGRLLLMRAPTSPRNSRSSLASSGLSRAGSLQQRLQRHRSLSGAQLHLGHPSQGAAPGPSTAPVPSRQVSQRSLPSSDGGSTAPPSPLTRDNSGGLDEGGPYRPRQGSMSGGVERVRRGIKRNPSRLMVMSNAGTPEGPLGEVFPADLQRPPS